jgi:hypothetical protein
MSYDTARSAFARPKNKPDMVAVRARRWLDEDPKSRPVRPTSVSVRTSGHQAQAKSGQKGGGGARNRPASRESVFRVLNSTKSAYAPIKQARYISRTGEQHADSVNRDAHGKAIEIPLENERGQRIEGRAAVDAEIASWGLKPDHENRSKKWDQATDAERLAMKSTDRLKSRQAVHMLFSVPKGSATAEQLGAAIREAAAEQFAGHKYVIAVHTDHGRPHVHLIVKYESEMRDRRGKPKRLHLSKDRTAGVREAFTEAAKRQGIDVQATRRVDRTQTREAIAQGAEPLKEHVGRTGGRRPISNMLREKAPGWYDQHGLTYEKHWRHGHDAPSEGTLKGFMSRFSARHKPLAQRGGELAELAKSFAHYKDADRAQRAFLDLARSDPKLAHWAWRKQPELFGVPASETKGTSPRFGQITKALKEYDAGKAKEPKPEVKAERDQAGTANAAKTERGRRASDKEKARMKVHAFADRAAHHPDGEVKAAAKTARKAAQDIREGRGAERPDKHEGAKMPRRPGQGMDDGMGYDR